jgi:hypothetical protein
MCLLFAVLVLYFTISFLSLCRRRVSVYFIFLTRYYIRSSLIIVRLWVMYSFVHLCAVYNGLQIVVLLVLPARVRWLSTVAQDPEDQLFWFATLLFLSSLIFPSSITVLRQILDSTLDRGLSSYLSHQFSLGQWRLATDIYFRHMN